ncbi:MAG: serine/threonine-protein kinase [Polyangiales bacterium]
MARAEEFDGWRVRGRLPGGNVGEVYRLTDGRVLKILRDELAGDVTRERFALEIHSQQAVESSAVPRVYETGQHEGRPYFVMEHRPGVSLAHALAEGHELPLAAIGGGVLSALADCHSSGVAHRDLKPDNVIVDGTSVSLIDFGVACALRTGGRAHVQWGSPTSWGPERLLGYDGADVRSELFAAGVLLFTLVARAHPFAHPEPAWRELLERCETPPLRAFAPAMSALDVFFQTALARQMEARFSSALRMRDAWHDVCARVSKG